MNTTLALAIMCAVALLLLLALRPPPCPRCGSPDAELLVTRHGHRDWLCVRCGCRYGSGGGQ